MNREDFPLLKEGYIYLDNSATTLKPQAVIDSINEYYIKYPVSAHRGEYSLSYIVNTKYEEARLKVANFINSNQNEIIFTSGTTESINILANYYFKNILNEGDEIIITKAEHASNVLPWFNLANKFNLKIVYAPLDNNYKLTLDNFKKVITNKTKLISLAEITNIIGDVRPIKEITKYAHQNNIYVVVDGAQSIPHLKTDVKDLDIDFLAFSGHKMCAPTGIGVLYGKEDLLEKLEPFNLGGGANISFDNEKEIKLMDVPRRFEGGTPNIEGILGLAAAIDYINNIGINNIREYELKLKQYLVSKLKEIKHIKLLNESSESGIVTFNVEGIFSQDVAFYLNKYNICVRAGDHCAKILKDITNVKNTVRISLYFYNTYEEIDYLVNLLLDKDKILKEMI